MNSQIYSLELANIFGEIRKYKRWNLQIYSLEFSNIFYEFANMFAGICKYICWNSPTYEEDLLEKLEWVISHDSLY